MRIPTANEYTLVVDDTGGIALCHGEDTVRVFPPPARLGELIRAAGLHRRDNPSPVVEIPPEPPTMERNEEE